MSQDLAQKFDKILDGISELDARLADMESRVSSLGSLGFTEKPGGQRIVYANRTNGALWYFWDRDEQEPIPIEKTALTGYLRDVFMYRKGDEASEKLCAVLDCGSVEYVLETGATATAGRGLCASLTALRRENDLGLLADPITVEVSPSSDEDEYDEALLLDLYAGSDPVLTESGDWPPRDNPDVVGGRIKAFRQAVAWSPPDPYDAAPDAVKNTGDSAAQEVGSEARSKTRSTDDSEDEAPSDRPPGGDGMPSYDPHDPPSIERDGPFIPKQDALRAWNVAKAHDHSETSFKNMLQEEFGVETPTDLRPQDWDRFWGLLDRDLWENQRETFEPDSDLPF